MSRAKINFPVKVMRIVTRMNVGGPAIQITTLLNGLSNELIDQQLYFGSCPPGEIELIKDIRDQKRLHKIPGFSRRVSFLKDFNVLFFLMRTILHESPDIIHTHTAKAGFLGRLAAMLTRSNAKRIHTFHGHVLYGYFSRSVSFLYGLVERFMAHFTDVIVSVGDQAQNDLEKWRIGTSSKRIVIYPGIPIGKKRDKYMARSELGIDLSKLTFAFIGRLTSIKRIDRIIEIARMCKLNSLDVQFIVAGDGSEYSKLKKSVDVERLSIHLLGWRSDVERILSAADALLLTSDNEGTPIASIQASLLGVPTISTKVGSVSDIVIDGESGILTSTLIEDIFQAILYVYNKPEVLSELGAKARTFANNNFSVERFLSDYQNLYLSVLNQR